MKKEKLFYQVVIIGLIIALVVCFVKIDNLSSRINQLDNIHSRDISSMKNQISSIHYDVEEQLKQEASLFTSSTIEYGTLNEENQKADVKIAVIPKTIIENMKVEVSLCGATAEMTKNANGEYSATVPVGIFEKNNTFPLVTITANDETKTEYLEKFSVDGLFTNYLPTISGGEIKTHTAKLDNGKLTVDGDFFIDSNLGDVDNSVKFIKYTFVTEYAGKEIARKDITDIVNEHKEIDDNTEHAIDVLDFKETYNVSGKDILTIYLVAEDSLGYLHKKVAFSWHHPDINGAIPEPAHAVEEAKYVGEIITDKNGKVLYGKEI